MLGFFKYSPFLVKEFGTFLVWTGLVTRDFWPVWYTVLPIGISFYTFQSMSYVIDVYRKVSHPHPHLLPFVSYVTLFPF
jgi:alginate O-acetyltransferase complex protein AlgI